MVNFLTRINSFKTRAKLIFLFLLFLGGFIFLTSPSAAEAADKYWVGGTGNWNDTSHWSLSSGGAGGASVPSNSDDVYFDANSGTGTATVNVSATTKSLNFTGYTGTFAGSSALNISGSLTMGSGMTRIFTGSITFNSTSTGNTLTFNGKTMASATTFNGVGGGWTLQDAWNNGSSNIILTAGTFNTNGQAVTTTGSFSVGSTSARTLTFGASEITVGTWTINSATNLTFNPNTSIITMTGSGTFTGGGLTYNEVRLTLSSTSNNGPTISGSNTFAVLRRTNTAFTTALSLNGNQTITNTFEVTGNNASSQRIWVRSNSVGTARTINVGNATVNLTNVDFTDITLSGNNAPYTGTSIGDLGGNSGITFTQATTRYWVGGSGAWTDPTKWSTTSGGAGGAGVPLAHDNVVFDANSFNATNQTVSISGSQGYLKIGKNIIWDGVTHEPLLNIFAPYYVTGSYILDSNMRVGVTTQGPWLVGREGNYTLSAPGLRLTTLTIDAPGSTYTLVEDLHIGSISNNSFFELVRGTFDANDNNVTLDNFSSDDGFVRALNMGSGIWELRGDSSAGIWDVAFTSAFTLNPGTSTIKLTGTLAADRVFAGDNLTYYNFENATSGNFAIRISGSNTFNNFKINPGRIQHFTAGTTITVNSFEAVGTEENPIAITSATAANHTLTKTGGGIISGDYLTISRSTATPSNTWYAGNNSTDGENNSGWLFESPNDPPNPPTSLGPEGLVDGSYTNDNKPTLMFSLSDPDESDTLKFRIQIDDTSNFSSPIVDYTSGLASQGSRSFTVGQVAGGGSYTVGSSGQSLSDGEYYWRVLATDSTGDSSAYTTANSGDIAFVLDDTPPTAPGIPFTDTPTELLTQNWVWTAATDILSGIASYIWRVVDSLGIPVTSGTTSLLEAVTSLPPGIYDFFVKAVDNAGNEGAESDGQVAVITPTPTPTPQPTATPTPAPPPDPCPGFVVCPNVNGVNEAPKLEIVSVGSGETKSEIIIPSESSSIDLKVTATQQEATELSTLETPIILPTRQGLNVVGEVYNFSAVSAFNGYPVPSLEKPAIILLSYDPQKLQGRSPKTLRIAYYSPTRKRWLVLPRNTVVNPETNSIANTSTELTYYTVVYPRGSFYVAPRPRVQGVSTKEVEEIIAKTTPSPKPKLQVVKKKVEKPKTCFLFICW